MKLSTFTPLLLLVPMALAAAGENALSRVEQSCNKYPTPEARADCEKSRKETMAAFDSAKKAEDKKAAADAAGEDQKKKNGLCFTRKASGEVVCPN